MPVSRAMRRLLSVREMEEEQSQVALERALEERRQLEVALAAARQREHAGRELLANSVATGELVDRVAGAEEIRAARRRAVVLKGRLAAAERAVELKRQEFLAKRIERRQVESLIQEQAAEEAVEAGRHAQRELDDWFLERIR